MVICGTTKEQCKTGALKPEAIQEKAKQSYKWTIIERLAAAPIERLTIIIMTWQAFGGARWDGPLRRDASTSQRRSKRSRGFLIMRLHNIRYLQFA